VADLNRSVKMAEDHKRRHMSMDIVTTVPPEILHGGGVMCLVCHRCGSKTLLQLRADESRAAG
jgi:hypothetical protein